MEKQNIYNFFSKSYPIAVIGVSNNKKKFGNIIYKGLKDKEFFVVPVNPKYDFIEEDLCYKSISALPSEINHALVVTRPQNTDAILKQLSENNIQNVWIQQHSNSNESLLLSEKLKLNVIIGKCAFMFIEPVRGIHAFHRGILKFFGKLP